MNEEDELLNILMYLIPDEFHKEKTICERVQLLVDRIADLERQLADERERSKAWQEFRQLMQLHHACPPDISADFIRAIMAVLKDIP